MHKFLPAAFVLGLATIPTEAAAESIAAQPLFGGAMIADTALAAIRGSADYSAGLTRRQARAAADLHASFDTRTLGSVARIEMDVWWGSAGSQLVANSVRSALP